MASSSISTKNGFIAAPYLKRTASLIKGATDEYIQDAMPTTMSTITGMRNTIKPFTSSLLSNSSNVVNKVKELNSQQTLRRINSWFLGMDNIYGDPASDLDLSFDIDVDNPDESMLNVQLSSEEKSANQISKTVIETSHKMVESQLSATANILTSMDKVGAVVASGFDNINDTLNRILDVTAKNTSALITATIGASVSDNIDSREQMLKSGKFNLGDYKKNISKNISSSEFGMISAILPMFSGEMGKYMLSSDNIANMGFAALTNKLAPNLKSNMKALDDSINGIILNSLIRLGDKRNDAGTTGMLGRLFGINTDIDRASTKRSSLEVKAVPFDTIAKEAMTGAIPGYLRKILVQLGGPDQVYDYRSRNFKSQASVARDFMRISNSSNSGKLTNAGKHVKSVLMNDGNDDENYVNLRNMVHELIMENMSNSSSDRNQISDQLKNPSSAKRYIYKLLKDTGIDKGDGKSIGQLAKAYTSLDNQGLYELRKQSISTNVDRNSIIRDYVSEAEQYGDDLSHISNTSNDRSNYIKQNYLGRAESSTVRSKASSTPMGGADYANAALYEIYRRLNTGINVFQVGSSNGKKEKYKWIGKLTQPKLYKAIDSDPDDTDPRQSIITSLSGYQDHTNVLTDNSQVDTDGNPLSGGQKFGKWASSSGKNFINALFSGDSEDVKNTFNQIVFDLGDAAAKPIKTFLMGDSANDKDGIFSKINDSFGNVTGYMKHQFMGTGYEYTDGAEKIKVSANEKGGIIGFLKDRTTDMYTGSKEKITKWTSEVSQYFDYGNDGDTGSKKRAIMAASIGAMSGLGFLGGPLGMIAGAMAGTALDSSGFGKKLKEKLFGNAELDEDGNKTGRRKLGILEKVTNSVVDPFRYQLGKTLSAGGEVLKKNILGPLSDIGYAIKERMSNAAGGVITKVFSTLFKGAGNILKGALNIPLSLFGLPTALAGNTIRAGMRVGGSVIGSMLGSVANLAGGRSAKGGLEERRSDRNDAIKDQRKDNEYYQGGMFSSLKSWKAAQNERRSTSNISDYTKRDIEIVESSVKTEQNTAEMAKDLNVLTSHATHHDPITNSSIFTSDRGVYDRIGEIVDFLKGHLGFKDKLSSTITKSDNDGILSAAVGIAAQSGLTNEDVDDISSIADSATGNAPKKRSLLSRFKSMLKRNATDEKIGGTGEGGTLSKVTKGIGNFISDILPSWALPLGGLVLSVMNPAIKTFLWGDGENEGVISNIGSTLMNFVPDIIGKAVGSIGDIIKKIFDKDEDGDISTSEISTTINNANSEMAEYTKPIVDSISINGTKLTGSSDPVGLVSSYRNAKITFGGIKALKSGVVTKQISSASKVIKNTSDMAKYVGVPEAFKLASKPAVSATTGSVTKIASGLKGTIKFIGTALSFVLDSVLMVFQGSETFNDTYTNSILQNVSLVIGGALGGTGGGVSDGFQWADVLDIAANAMKWASLGFTLGSVVPLLGNGVGAIIGFILGMILGMWGGKEISRDMAGLLDNVNAESSTPSYRKRPTSSQRNSRRGHGLASNVWDNIKAMAVSATAAFNSVTGKAKEIFNLFKQTKWDSVESLLQLIVNISDVVGGSGHGPTISQRSYSSKGNGQSQYYQGNYGSAYNMSASGCGPIAAAYMANAYGSKVTPMETAGMLNNGGYRDSLGGTTSNGISAVNNQLGIPARTGPVNMNAIGNKLSNNEPVVFLGKSSDPNSPYTESGHFVVGEDIDNNGNITVMDPLNPIKKKYKVQNVLNGLQETTYVDGDYGFGGESSITGRGNPLNKDFVITSPFGDNSSFRRGFTHKGIDMVPTDASKKAEVGAVYNGTITSIRSDLPDSYTGLSISSKTGGNFVEYKTPDGVIVSNMHLKANSIPSNIRVGSPIKAGDRIGEMGSTGMSSGPHLHYQFKSSDGKYINPTGAVSNGSTVNGFNATASPYISSSDGSTTGGILGGLNSIYETVSSSFKSLFGLDSKSDILSSSSLNTSGYVVDNASSSIIFTKVKNLDTSYPDYPGREHLSADTLNFILRVAPGVQATMDCGVLASIRIAQAALESSWGTSGATKEGNNLFGMKAGSAWTGKRISKQTKEWSSSQGYYNTNSDFRAYNSWDDSIADQAKNYTTVDNYRKAGLINEKDYKQAANKLQNSGYATDPNYADKIMKIIDQYYLIYFDHLNDKSSSSSAYNNAINQSSIDRYGRENIRNAMDVNAVGGDIDSYTMKPTAEYNRQLSSLRSNPNLRNVGAGTGRSKGGIRPSGRGGYGSKHPGSVGYGTLDEIMGYNKNDYPDIINTGNEIDRGNKLEQLLAAALIELKAINTNTGDSSSRLLELATASGGEDIVPQKMPSRKIAPSPISNSTNISSIMSIIRPM